MRSGRAKIITIHDYRLSPSEQRVTYEDKTWISTPYIDREETKLEWKIFRRVLLSQFSSSSVPESSDSTSNDLQEVTSRLLTDSTLNAAVSNLNCYSRISATCLASYKSDC